MMEFTHKPVLLAECLDRLNIRPGGVYLDGTLGRAGHSLEIARRLTTGRLIAIDRDRAALDAAPARFGNYLDRVTLVRGSFGNLPSILSTLDVGGVDGMLFDLGGCPPPSWTMATGASPIYRMPRWICAWISPPPSPPGMW